MKVRGHHLLCLLAYTGEGYSPSFQEQFVRMVHAYRNPETPLEVADSPDDACTACPHLAAAGCRSEVDGPEAEVASLDRQVLDALGLKPGSYSAGEVHDRLRALGMDELKALCSTCSWFEKLGCQKLIMDELAQLKSASPPPTRRGRDSRPV